MTNIYQARETWLSRAVEIFRPRFVETGYPVPDKIRVSVGFGPSGARQENSTILGVTLNKSCAADGVNEIWISPVTADTANMLGTLVHELIHAALNHAGVARWHGHSGEFAEVGTRLGLEGKMASSKPSLELYAECITIADTLGEYPGAEISVKGLFATVPVEAVLPGGTPVSSGPRTQTNRHVKLSCTHPGCECGGYVVRTSRSWIEKGLPSCPFGSPMTEA